MEEELTKSEQKFRTVSDHTYNWEYWIDPKGNFIYISPSCERITGYAQKEFLQNSKLITDIIHPDDLAIVKGHKHKVFGTGEVEEIEFRIITKSKKERWIGHICQTVYDNNGINIGQRGSNRDITESKQAEEELKKSEEKLLQAQYLAKMGDFTWNIQTGEVSWSDGMHKLLKYDKDEKNRSCKSK